MFVDIAPLAQPRVRQARFATGPAERAATVLFLQLLVKAPQLEQTDEIGPAVAKPRVSLFGRLAFAGRSIAGILDFERRGDHQHLAKTAFIASRQNHASNSRIDRKASQCPAHVGQPATAIEGAEFIERPVAVPHEIAMGRIEQWQRFQTADAERLATQQGTGERRAADLRGRVAIPREIVLLRVQTNANTRSKPPAAPRPLVGRRLRNGLNRQPLHLASGDIATHSR